LRDNLIPLTASVLLHVGVLAALVVGLDVKRPHAPPAQVALQATVVDETEIQEQMRELEAAEERSRREREAEEQRLKEQAEAARQEREQELARLEEARRERERAEEQAAEAERQRQLEQERVAEEAARKEAQEQAAREEQERLERLRREREAEEARLAEIQRKKEEAERQRQEEERKRREAEEARKRAEREAELQRMLEAEEDRLSAVDSGLLNQYKTVIRQTVERNWVKPAVATAGIDCEVLVTQLPSRDIVNVQIGDCNADETVRRSIETAVLKSSPLPPPPDASLFERNLRFRFRPEQ
jgi:colicin import membrane protein